MRAINAAETLILVAAIAFENISKPIIPNMDGTNATEPGKKSSIENTLEHGGVGIQITSFHYIFKSKYAKYSMYGTLFMLDNILQTTTFQVLHTAYTIISLKHVKCYISI